MMGNIEGQNKVQHENPYGSFIDEWELQPDIIVKDDMISEGVFGQVYHGHVRGPLQNKKLISQFRNAVTLSVAIKMLKGSLIIIIIESIILSCSLRLSYW